MSTPSIKVGQGNWGIKATSLLGYANTDKKFVAREFTVGRLLNTATRVNASGNIEGVNADIPRIDYFGGQASLLVEPSAQNLVLRSQELDVTPTWSRNLGGTGLLPSITANAVVSPDGTQNAETIVFDRGAGNTINDRSFLDQSITIPTTGAYILSVYAKASTAGDVGKQIFIRLGSAGALTPITLTANWVRYSRAETSVASGSQAVQIGNRGTFTADNSVSVDLWGAQAEAGSIATSYIPTTTAAVTRSADVISRTSATALIGQTEGTIYLDLTVLGKGSSSATRWLQIFGASNNIGLAINSSNLFRSIVNTQSDTLLTAPLISSGVKVAWAYDATGTTCFINGTQYMLTLGGNQTMSSLTSISIDGSANTAFGFARIRALELYPNRLTNDQLAALTTL